MRRTIIALLTLSFLAPVWASTTARRGLILAVQEKDETSTIVTVRIEWSSWSEEGTTVAIGVSDRSKSLMLDGVKATRQEALKVGHLIQECKGYVECFSDPGYLSVEATKLDPANGVYHLALRQSFPVTGTVRGESKGVMTEKASGGVSPVALHLSVRQGKVVAAAASVLGRRNSVHGNHFSGVEVDPGTLTVDGNRLQGRCTLKVHSVTLFTIDGDTGTRDIPLDLDLTINGGRVTGELACDGEKIEPSRPIRGGTPIPAVSGRLEAHRQVPPDVRFWVRCSAGYTTTTWLFFRKQGDALGGDYFARYKPDPLQGAVTPTQITLADGQFQADIDFVVGRDGSSEHAKLQGVLIGDKLYGTCSLATKQAVFREGYFQGQVMRYDAPIVVNPRRRDRLPATALVRTGKQP
jgi:hypothetical protein